MANRDLHGKLRGLGSQLFGLSQPTSSKSTSSALPARYCALAAALSGELTQRTAGSFCVCDTQSEREHGEFILTELFPESSIAISSFTRTAERGEIPIEQMRFIDTETTGLGGSGTIPFLIGIGKIVSDKVHVRQFFLPDYSDEAGMLEAVCEELPEGCILISYNGIAFDLPALMTRSIVNRVTNSLQELPHYDLLYAVRRLYKRRLKDCSLQNIEREVLGFMRTDDMPGYLIPGTYFDWLSTENTEVLPSVLEHNRLDIVSLPFLTGLIAEVFAQQGETLSEIDDLHSLSRTYGVRGENQTSYRLFERMKFLSTGLLADDLLLYHANNCKRMKNYSEAVTLWRQMAGTENRTAIRATLELAKYYEHIETDCQTALSLTAQIGQTALLSKTEKAALEKRIARLNLKISRLSAG